MTAIRDRLNKRFQTLLEAETDISWKDPDSENYDRQWAEDALYHTIGPLTDSPRWIGGPRDKVRDWTSPSEPVPGFTLGGPAPRWTQEEVIAAFAGDPSMLFTAPHHPKSPMYGNKGGAPLFRLASKVARIYGRPTDRQFIADLYSNGFVPLIHMMQPGFDRSIEPFIKFAIRSIRSAMEHGTGGTTEGDLTQDISGKYFATPAGEISHRITTDPLPPEAAGVPGVSEKWTDLQIKTWRAANRAEKLESGNWTEHTAIGIKGIVSMTDPNRVREASNIIQGKYRTEEHLDRNLENPLGPYSPKYFFLTNAYADALETLFGGKY